LPGRRKCGYHRKGLPPEIHISAQEKDREWDFSVRDNGIGIEEEHLEQIFAPFKRLSREGDHRQRHRLGNLPKDRGGLWRADLGGIGIWNGIDFPLYDSGG
jgi:signal transduction histidine kinase